jgi:hypothetical protein
MITVRQGTRAELNVRSVEDADGSALDLTGATVRAVLKYGTATARTLQVTLTNPSDGQYRVLVSESDTIALVPGRIYRLLIDYTKDGETWDLGETRLRVT